MRILFFCEAVTFAHIVRPIQLAKSLNNAEIYIASSSFPKVISEDIKGFCCINLKSLVTSEDFIEALYNGKYPYNEEIYDSYIKEDCEIIESVNPDVVVGDFRVSLPISCKIKDVPLVTLSNLVWSPCQNLSLEPPENNIVKVIGPKAAKWIFNKFSNFFFANIIKQMNKVRSKHGLSPLNNLFEIHTAGDYVAYLDIEGFTGLIELPKNHRVIGPPVYSAPAPLPPWMSDLDDGMTNIFLSLGSSGDVKKLQLIVNTLSKLSVRTIVATSGRTNLEIPNKNVFVEEYLPMREIVKHCHILIDNGGSLMNYIALEAGVPIIGIPYNLDQYQTISCVKSLGAAEWIRSGFVSKKSITNAVEKILSDQRYKLNAESLSMKIKGKDTYLEFEMLLEEITESSRLVQSKVV